jgi:hypothetical protein
MTIWNLGAGSGVRIDCGGCGALSAVEPGDLCPKCRRWYAPKIEIGQTVYQAEGEWIDGRPIAFSGTSYHLESDARDEITDRLSALSTAETRRVKSCWVRPYTVESLDDDAVDGIGSMVSCGPGVKVVETI